MRRYSLIGVTSLLLSCILASSVFAWHYNDGTEDSLFDRFGPRAGKLLIRLHADEAAEWNALKDGYIDLTDWPLSKTVYDELAADYDNVIEIANYGPEFGLFLLDMNSNNNQYMGNPPDPAYANPVADHNPATGNPKIDGGSGPANDYNPMSSVWLRRAIAYLIDRPGIIAGPAIGDGFGYPAFTAVPPVYGKYHLDIIGDPTVPWAWSYNPAASTALLDANWFPINPGTGYRYWDRNHNSIEEADERVELIFYIRSDDPPRYHIGTVLLAELQNINLRINHQYSTSGPTFIEVMVNKNFHLYTGSWSLNVNPTHLILWSWDYYWHPGFSYNYCGHNDPEFNQAAEGLLYTNTQLEAETFAFTCQYRQALMVLSSPIYCPAGNKAYYKTNTGGHFSDPSETEVWEDSIVNILGHGIDNTDTLLNMHTVGHEDDPGMVIDWGFKVPEIKRLNPVYTSWLYDWNVLDLYYESLGARNASNLGQWLPWIAKSTIVDAYSHPVFGVCSKIRYTLRHDAKWHDGTPVTAADVRFTFIELQQILYNRGLPNPWWWSNVQDILSFTIMDPFNFEVLLDLKSYWAASWISGNIILPKHIWKTIAETGDPQAVQPDPNLIGSGPWKFVEYNKAGAYLSSDKYQGGHDVSPLSFYVKSHPDLDQKFDLGEGEHITVTVQNEDRRDSIQYDLTVTVQYKTGLPVITTYTGATLIAYEKRDYVIPRVDMYGMFEVHVKTGVVWEGKTITTDVRLWRGYVTIKEDITGSTYYNDIGMSTYPYKSQLPSPDTKVDIKDVGTAAKAFGSYPGHKRWSIVADINSDYYIDIKDIAAIAKMFGWIGI